jgi:hypothetical protein
LRDCWRFLRLVATALLARDHATVIPFDRSGHYAAVSPWANGHATGANADGDIWITSVAVAIIAIPPELNIDALGLDRNSEGGSG